MMATALKTLLGVWIAATVAYIFLVLPPAEGFASPPLARLIALHLPNAVVAVIAAFVGTAFAIRYLRSREPLDDIKSRIAAILATVFCLLTTVTGMVFARYQWGAYWNWDPKQTCIFLLLLVYAAYFLLRASIADPERQATVGAVYMVFAGIMTPMLGYVVPKFMPSLHPKNAAFDASYHLAIWSLTAGLVGLYMWMQNVAVRAERLRLAAAEAGIQ